MPQLGDVLVSQARLRQVDLLTVVADCGLQQQNRTGHLTVLASVVSNGLHRLDTARELRLDFPDSVLEACVAVE